MRISWIIEEHGAFLSLIVAYIMFRNRKMWTRAGKVLFIALIVNSVILATDVITYRCEGMDSMLSYIVMQISMFLLYLMQYFEVYLMGLYIDATISNYVQRRGKREWLKAMQVLCIIAMLGLFINQWTGIYYTISPIHNAYSRGPLFGVAMPLGAIAMLIGMIRVYDSRGYIPKGASQMMGSIFLIPLLGAVLQWLQYGVSFMNLGMTISVMIIFAVFWYQQRKQERLNEASLVRSRAYLLNSQIRPHFLFNSLAVIQALVDEDPERAKDAIDHFSNYIETGLSMEVTETTISIKEELDYVKSYLYLEKLRFGKKLEIIYDIPENIDFQIPFLSIQPIVENAVRHGIRKKIDGGFVKICIRKEPDCYEIFVIDNGTGFDVDLAQENALKGETTGNGVGLMNVKERIRLLCDGNMKISSVKGEGTTVLVNIPCKKDRYRGTDNEIFSG